MGTNSIIIVLGVIVLILIGIAWTWQYLSHQLKRLKTLERELSSILEDRRDVIPYLIESYRNVIAHPSEQINTVIAKRAEARDTRDFETMWKIEQELENLLEVLFNETKTNQPLETDIGWLESRTEIQKAWENVNKKEKHWQDLKTFMRSKLTQFPFTIFKGVKSFNI